MPYGGSILSNYRVQFILELIFIQVDFRKILKLCYMIIDLDIDTRIELDLDWFTGEVKDKND